LDALFAGAPGDDDAVFAVLFAFDKPTQQHCSQTAEFVMRAVADVV
jgi:hypothetical protein